MNLTVRELTRALKGQLVLGDPKKAASHASVDSRRVESGALFFALKGDNADGHDFAMSALRQGAAAVVVSRLDWLKSDKSLTGSVIRVEDVHESLKLLGHHIRTQFKGPVIGITGSNGKTTTKQMVASVMKALGPGLFTMGNYNSQIGLPLVLSAARPEDRWMALEMGASAPGNIAALADIARPTIGIITSIGPAHLATFGSIKKVAESKWELMESLGADGAAIVPWGDEHLEPLIRSYTKRIVFFGENQSCPVRASSIEMGEKISFLIHIGSNSARVTLPLPGRVNVSNALAAAAAGWVAGVSIEDIVKGLQTFEPPRMRMEVLRHPSGAIIINDAYNANPASMLQSMRTLQESYPDRKRVAVLGSMKELGDESEKLHFHLGAELGHSNIDKIYLIGKETEGIREGGISGGGSEKKFQYIDLMDDVVKAVRGHLDSKTVILFKASRSIQLDKAVDALFKETF